MLTTQIEYLKKASKNFTDCEVAGFFKIIFGQSQAAEDVQKLNEKFGDDEKIDIKCTCGGHDSQIILLRKIQGKK